VDLIEAAKSGRPFRRKSWTHNDYMIFQTEIIVWLSNNLSCSLNFKDSILADDYELKPEEKLISKPQLVKAWDKSQCGLRADSSSLFTTLCKELGLED